MPSQWGLLGKDVGGLDTEAFDIEVGMLSLEGEWPYCWRCSHAESWCGDSVSVTGSDSLPPLGPWVLEKMLALRRKIAIFSLFRCPVARDSSRFRAACKATESRVVYSTLKHLSGCLRSMPRMGGVAETLRCTGNGR